MKKVISIILTVLMVLAMPISANAASQDYGTVSFSIAYGSVWLFDQKEAALNTLDTMVILGLSDKAESDGVYDYDLDRDGSFDLTYEDGAFSRNSNTNLTGQWDYSVPYNVTDYLIGENKDYCSRFLIEFDDTCPKGGKHEWKEYIQKATFGKDGCTYVQCTKCQKKEVGWPILKVSASLKTTSFTYNGKAKKPVVNISTADGPLGKEYYKVTYSDNVKAGTAKAKVTLLGDYFGGTKTFEFKIKKAPNKIIAKAKKVTLNSSALQNDNQTIKSTSAITVKKAKGKVTYKKIKGSSKIDVNQNGNITVKKGLKAGSYRVKIKVTAKGNANYKSKSKTVTLLIRVK